MTALSASAGLSESEALRYVGVAVVRLVSEKSQFIGNRLHHKKLAATFDKLQCAQNNLARVICHPSLNDYQDSRICQK